MSHPLFQEVTGGHRRRSRNGCSRNLGYAALFYHRNVGIDLPNVSMIVIEKDQRGGRLSHARNANETPVGLADEGSNGDDERGLIGGAIEILGGLTLL